MDTRITEIADGIHQLATFVPEMDFGFNQYLVLGEESLLFHTGLRGMFPVVSSAVARITRVDGVRWIGFGHVEADECGSVNEWLSIAPQATVVHGATGCMVSVADLADRAPRPLTDGEVLDIGGHRLRWIDTPHVPHAWEAGLLFDEVTETLFCGDLFSQWGPYPATTDGDIVGPAVADADSSWMSLAPSSGNVLRSLSDLRPATLAQMHGPAFVGDCGRALLDLAADLEKRITDAA